jgi:hypothetical protein
MYFFEPLNSRVQRASGLLENKRNGQDAHQRKVGVVHLGSACRRLTGERVA